jgi:hypothetical protein
MPVTSTIVTQYYTGIFRQAPSAAVSSAYQAMANDTAALNSMISAANLQVDPVVRLYQTAFNRLPDNAGMTAWVVPFSTGAITLQAIANGFTQSTEFTTLYPTSMSNAQFVGALYYNILQRTGEDAGIKGWVDALNNGSLTRAQVLVGFSDSAEFTAKVQTNVDQFLKNIANTTIANQGQGSLYTGNLFDVSGGAVTTYIMTTGVDSIAGSAGPDTFIGIAATTSPTFQAFDTLEGGSGIDTLNLTVDTLAANSIPVATVSAIEIISVRNVSGNAQTIALGNFVGATELVSDRSTGAMTVTGMTAGQALTIKGDGSTANGTMANTYASTVTSATMNIKGGVTAGAITQTAAGLTTQTINSSGAANTVGAIALSGAATVTSLTINADTTLTTGNITNFGGTAAKITIAGAAASSTTGLGVTIGTIENTTVASIDASGLTAGGLSATLSANTALVVKGGQGNDRITTGAVLTTGSVDAGAGTADRLILAADADVASLTLGNKYSNFEVVQIAGGGTQNLDFLATNNVLSGLRLAGSATVTNINSATAANVTVLASSTASLGVKGATTPGQIDTVTMTVTDELAAVNTITLTAPTLAGVEILNIVATDSTTITSLANAAALSNLNVSGAGNVSITTGALAPVTNATINASAGTGTFTFTAAAATGGNALSITGSATGVNTITGTANGDIITGGSANDTLVNQTTLVTASASDVLTGGSGFDAFVLRGDTATGTVSTILSTTSRIADFVVGSSTTTTDVLTFTATKGDYGNAATDFAAGVAVAAAGSTGIQSVTANAGAAAYVAGTDMIKLTTGVTTTGTLQAAFNAAIGTATVTGLGAGTEIYFSMYDTTNSRMLVGLVDTASGTNTVIETGDTVSLIGSINMTAADYAAFANTNLAIIA